MPVRTQIFCDGCKAKKQDTNQWYTLTIQQQSAEVAPFTVLPIEQRDAEEGTVRQYYCGRYCLYEALSKWMDELTKQPCETSASSNAFQSSSNETAIETQQHPAPRSIRPRPIVLRRSTGLVDRRPR